MDNNLDKIRHSASHVLAMAVIELFPEVKLAIGPSIDDGFYYDFELPRNLTEDDLPKIEAIMEKIKKQNIPFVESKMEIHEGHKFFSDKGQDYKVELIEDLIKDENEEISIYSSGDFIDLCKGPHVSNTGEIGYFKLTKIAGAYWKGSEKNKMLTRIYGTTWTTAKELEEYSQRIEQAVQNDHRKLGKELGLFVFSDLVGSGLPLYTPKGALLRSTIQNYSKSLRNRINYEEVYTPQINKADLFKTSGHYEKYKKNMFSVKSNYSDDEFFLKPMNCPQHIQIYASQIRSYKDLPIRYSDYANLYRDEKPGELSGLTRLRAFSQDDAHCFCREDQIKDEFNRILSAIKDAMTKFDLEYSIRLSLRDEKKQDEYLGDQKIWHESQELLEQILVENEIKFVRAEGEAAFYGPKMDLIIKDSLGREWQLSTIQLDLNMPSRFEIKYTDQDGIEKTPIMIHSAILGSPERFMGILIEHYKGSFPVWLAPVQIKIITVSNDLLDDAQKIKETLTQKNIRVELDQSNETVGKKIRNAEMEKIPYIITYGKREQQSSELSVRINNEVKVYTIEKLIEEILK